MDLETLEKTFILMRKHKVLELRLDDDYIKLADDFDDTLSPETQKALAQMQKAEQATDEEVLFNPYAGLEGIENNE